MVIELYESHFLFKKWNFLKKLKIEFDSDFFSQKKKFLYIISKEFFKWLNGDKRWKIICLTKNIYKKDYFWPMTGVAGISGGFSGFPGWKGF